MLFISGSVRIMHIAIPSAATNPTTPTKPITIPVVAISTTTIIQVMNVKSLVGLPIITILHRVGSVKFWGKLRTRRLKWRLYFQPSCFPLRTLSLLLAMNR